MATFTVFRHGDRWALREGDADTPIAEYETRELAELAAKDRGDYEIDDTPRDENLGGGAIGDEDGHVRTRDAGIDQRTGGAGSGDQTTSEPQGGL